MRFLVRIIDRINISTGKSVSLLIFLIAVVIIYEVILRGFFNKPTEWAHETSGMLFLTVLMLGAGYTLYWKAHVRVDILVAHMRPRTQAVIDILTQTLLLFYGSIVLWKSWNLAVASFVRMDVSETSWQPVLFPMKFIIVLGVALLLLQLLAKYIRDFYILSTGKELELK